MKLIISVIMLLFIQINILFGQIKFKLNDLSKDSIEYVILLKSSKGSDGLLKNDGNFIGIRFDTTEINYLKSLNYTEWIKLLKSNYSDWATNLILYCLFDREATIFTYGINREDWVKEKKNEDIEYWKAFLSDSMNLELIFVPDSLWKIKDEEIRKWDSLHDYFYKFDGPKIQRTR
jgi:hypothetical protein